MFSYNSKHGWCTACYGTGLRLTGFDEEQTGEETSWNAWYEGEEETCGACHGPEGKGVTGLGKDMTHSEFIAEKTDAELLEFIKVGRAPDDPLNTTGVLMPPKGGNPALTDQQLMDIIAYVRSIHE